jgi:hypothetical protein
MRLVTTLALAAASLLAAASVASAEPNGPNTTQRPDVCTSTYCSYGGIHRPN